MCFCLTVQKEYGHKSSCYPECNICIIYTTYSTIPLNGVAQKRWSAYLLIGES